MVSNPYPEKFRPLGFAERKKKIHQDKSRIVPQQLRDDFFQIYTKKFAQPNNCSYICNQIIAYFILWK